MVAVAFAETATVLTVNVAEVAPAATVTVAGTVADVELELRLTGYPPVGAALEMVTVPVLLVPPTTLVGFNVTLLTVGPSTMSGPVILVVPTCAPMLAVTVLTTPLVVAVKVAVEEPAGTGTVPGTVTAV